MEQEIANINKFLNHVPESTITGFLIRRNMERFHIGLVTSIPTFHSPIRVVYVVVGILVVHTTKVIENLSYRSIKIMPLCNTKGCGTQSKDLR